MLQRGTKLKPTRRRGDKSPQLWVGYQLTIAVVFILTAAIVTGCGFHRLWSFSPIPDTWDSRIPGWRVKLGIVHLCLESNEPPLRFLFEIEVKPYRKNPDILLGLDSIRVIELAIDGARIKETSYSFLPILSQLDDQTNTHKILEDFDQLPDRLICIVYYTLLNQDSGVSEESAVEYPLFFKKKRRFWLGT